MIASVGHDGICKDKLGIDIENNFEPQYIPIAERERIIKETEKKKRKMPLASISEPTLTARERLYHGI